MSAAKPPPKPPTTLAASHCRWSCPRSWVRADEFTSPEPTTLWGRTRVLAALDLLAMAGEHPAGLDVVSAGRPGEARAIVSALESRVPGRVELVSAPSKLALRGRGGPGLLADPTIDVLVFDSSSLAASDAWPALREALAHGVVTETPPKDETTGPTHRARASIVLVGPESARKKLKEKDPSFDACWSERTAFAPDLPRDKGGVGVVAAKVRSEATKRGFGEITDGALAFLIEQNAGRPSRRHRVSLRTDRLLRVLAGARAHQPSGPLSTRTVRSAWEALAWRGDVQETGHRARLALRQLQVTTSGHRRGVVNGLMVYGSGDASYCIPGRITARVAVGREGVINIERESKYSGRSFDKGIFHLAGWLRGTFAGPTHPLGLAASVAFEQSYGKVDGDSATLAETLAILSELTELPCRQDIALTGAITQRGSLLPIGSVSLKTRGWWESCRSHGPLTGTQGVLIPAASAPDLQLDRDVLRDVRAGRFHVWTAERIDDAAELVFGRASGYGTNRPGPATVLGLAARRLRQMSERLYPPRKPAGGANTQKAKAKPAVNAAAAESTEAPPRES
ncbi:MAG: AAA family ATPase [Deltaproteobacteria bacterium]|nr:AAA family ATPase [Deltaproteobacteria bacterium]